MQQTHNKTENPVKESNHAWKSHSELSSGGTPVSKKPMLSRQAARLRNKISLCTKYLYFLKSHMTKIMKRLAIKENEATVNFTPEITF